MPARISLWLLASAGVLVGHVLGYAVAHPHDADRAVALAGHAYLGPLGMVLVPAGLVAVLGVGVRTVRRIGGVPSLRHLASAQVALFVCQELGERHLGPGAPLDVISERGVWFGLLAQVLVAWVALRLVRVTERVLRAVTADRRRLVGAAIERPLSHPTGRVQLRTVDCRLPLRRGPPRRVGAPAVV